MSKKKYGFRSSYSQYRQQFRSSKSFNPSESEIPRTLVVKNVHDEKLISNSSKFFKENYAKPMFENLLGDLKFESIGVSAGPVKSTIFLVFTTQNQRDEALRQLDGLKLNERRLNALPFKTQHTAEFMDRMFAFDPTDDQKPKSLVFTGFELIESDNKKFPLHDFSSALENIDPKCPTDHKLIVKVTKRNSTKVTIFVVYHTEEDADSVLGVLNGQSFKFKGQELNVRKFGVSQETFYTKVQGKQTVFVTYVIDRTHAYIKIENPQFEVAEKQVRNDTHNLPEYGKVFFIIFLDKLYIFKIIQCSIALRFR